MAGYRWLVFVAAVCDRWGRSGGGFFDRRTGFAGGTGGEFRSAYALSGYGVTCKIYRPGALWGMTKEICPKGELSKSIARTERKRDSPMRYKFVAAVYDCRGWGDFRRSQTRRYRDGRLSDDQISVRAWVF